MQQFSCLNVRIKAAVQSNSCRLCHFVNPRFQLINFPAEDAVFLPAVMQSLSQVRGVQVPVIGMTACI